MKLDDILNAWKSASRILNWPLTVISDCLSLSFIKKLNKKWNCKTRRTGRIDYVRSHQEQQELAKYRCLAGKTCPIDQCKIIIINVKKFIAKTKTMSLIKCSASKKKTSLNKNWKRIQSCNSTIRKYIHTKKNSKNSNSMKKSCSALIAHNC